MTDRIRVMIVDDHVFWRHGVRQIVSSQEDMEVVAEAGDGQEAVRRAISTRPDVILMDINMPSMNGVEAARAISGQLPDTRIVMLTVSDTDDNLVESLKAGAVGFLLKEVAPESLTQGIRDTMDGESTLSPFIAARMVKFIQVGMPQEQPTVAANLTEREDEILRLIARGARDKEIADKLYISESTVKKHVQNVLRKLHARNRVEAVSHLRPQNPPQSSP
jgi:DNA-binding NarL/FixJ family response regulator